MRSSRRGTKAGIAALMSFTLIAAACGGNDDGGADDSGTATVPATDAPDETGDTTDSGGETTDTGDDTTTDTAEDVAPVNTDGDEVRVVEGEIPGGDPVPGGTLRYALEADVDGINPTSSALSSPGLMMGNAVFDTLTAATVDGGFVPVSRRIGRARRRLPGLDRHAPRRRHVPRRNAAQRRCRAEELRDAAW